MADAWLNISSWNIHSYCGWSWDYGESNLENALDGIYYWAHQLQHTHWFILDLGDVYTVKYLRGRSNALTGDPTDVDVYVSNLTSFNWFLVATAISLWQDRTYWVEWNCSDRHGRYVKVEILETEDYPWNWLYWGGAWPSGPFFPIFDVYGCLYEVSIYLGGQASCAASVGDAELNGIAVSLSSETGGMLDPESEVTGLAIHLSSETGSILGTTSVLGDQFCYLKGEINITSSVVASGIGLGVSVPLHGSTAGVSSASGTLEFAPFTELVAGIVSSGTSALGVLTDASVRLSGTITCRSTVEGELTTPTRLAGIITIGSTVKGKLTVPTIHYLNGLISIHSSVNGVIAGITKYHWGIITAQSSVNGEITITYTGVVPVYLGGTITISSTTNGTMAGVLRSLAAVVSITSSTSGSLTRTRGFVGTVTCSSSCTSNLTTRTSIVGTVTSSVAIGGMLKVTRRLIGTIAVESTASGKLEVENIFFLDGEITVSGTTNGSLKITKKLCSLVSSESVLSGLLVITQKLVSIPITIQSSVAGSMERGKGLTGTIAVTLTSTACLSLEKKVTGDVISTSTVSGNLIRAGEFSGSVAVYSTVDGLLVIGRKLVGTVAIISTVGGNLRYSVPHFVIATVTISPVLVCTVVISSTLEGDANNQPVLAHAVRASPVFTFETDNSPIFEHSTRINDELKLLTV